MPRLVLFTADVTEILTDDVLLYVPIFLSLMLTVLTSLIIIIVL